MALNGGVRVYQDNLRVYSYGEPADDWLNLDRTRINEPVAKIGNRNILAAVILNRQQSQDLKEKTNREGFIENEAYKTFKDAVNFAIDLFAGQRNIDKTKMRKLLEDNPSSQPVTYQIDDLKSIIEDKFQKIDFEDKDQFTKEVITGLNHIKSQYLNNQEIMLKGASAGLSLSVVIHEIDKRIKELVATVKSNNANIDNIRNSVQAISGLVDSFTALIASDQREKIEVGTVVQNALFSSEYRFNAHRINSTQDLQELSERKISCRPNMVVGMIINLFDNSIYWLNKYKVDHKKIFIGAKLYGDQEIGIIIADNGRGFRMNFEDAISTLYFR